MGWNLARRTFGPLLHAKFHHKWWNVTYAGPRGEKPQNRPVSNLSTGTLRCAHCCYAGNNLQPMRLVPPSGELDQTLAYIRYRPKLVVLILLISTWPIMLKHDVIHKTVSVVKGRPRAMLMSNLHKIGEVWMCGFWDRPMASRHRPRPTDIETNRHIDRGFAPKITQYLLVAIFEKNNHIRP